MTFLNAKCFLQMILLINKRMKDFWNDDHCDPKA